MKRYCQCKLRPREFEECGDGVWVKYSDAREVIQEACNLLHSALEFGNGGEIDHDKICAFVNKYDKDIAGEAIKEDSGLREAAKKVLDTLDFYGDEMGAAVKMVAEGLREKLGDSV